MDSAKILKVVINKYKKCLILTLPDIFTEQIINTMKSEIPKYVKNQSGKGIVFDFSPVNTLDKYEFNIVRGLGDSAKLLGLEYVFVGLKPGIIIALLDMDANTDGIIAKINMEEGMEYILNV